MVADATDTELSQANRPLATRAEARRPLSPAAERALREAAARRAAYDRAARDRLPESQGRGGGLDPTRYGDWENKGLASDF